jgi:hypothetical protein
MTYGYNRRVLNEFGLKQMKEVTVAARPEALRELAMFLVDAARQLETESTSDSWHRHCDSSLKRSLGCDFIVAAHKPEARR